VKKFIQTLNKYVVLFIVSGLFGMPWIYLRNFIIETVGYHDFIEYFPTIIDYLIRLIIIVLLVVDFRKERLKNVWLTCIATLLYPLLGVVIFTVLLIEKEKKPVHNIE